jgi:hypothetical protein
MAEPSKEIRHAEDSQQDPGHRQTGDGMTEPTTDDLIELCSAAARKEVCDLMECLRPADLTTCEVLAIVAVLRSARGRLDATKREPV